MRVVNAGRPCNSMTTLNHKFAIVVVLALMLANWLPGGIPSTEAQTPIRLGTLAPDGSSYHRFLLEMGEAWRNGTGGAVRLTVFPGGRQGGEADMVRKMRIGQINAGTLTAVGLSDIEPAISCLQYMPMVFRSWEEVDYVREKLAPQLEKKLSDKGFVVLFWGDAGWVHFFSNTAVARPADLKKMKVFVWSGDTYQLDLMKALGYQPVPLETADILPSLQTGMINVTAMPPYVALAGQIDGPAPHMLDMNWAPIVGATVLRKDVWDRIPPAAQEVMKKAAAAAGEKMKEASRKENEEAVAAMRKRGLQVHAVTPEIVNEWQQLAESVYPNIRGKMVPADMFDEVIRLLKERRAAKGPGK
jgi:TRAP-type transport system periplasmic protein